MIKSYLKESILTQTKMLEDENLLSKTGGIVHDRYIILDYNTKYERIYHCGSSSKDSGKRITTIMESYDNSLYHTIIDDLISN